MKLYTKQQIKRVWKAGQKYWETSGASITLEELLEQLTPIELPSDEEIQKEADAFLGLDSYNQTFTRGAKWMRDKLTNAKEK